MYKIHQKYPGYRFGDDGSIWSCKKPGPGTDLSDTWKLLCGKLTDDYYLTYQLTDSNGEIHNIRGNRIILEVFEPTDDTSLWALHKNNIRYDNRYSNLYLGTPLQNSHDMVTRGNALHGERCHSSILTDEKVIEMRLRYRQERISMEQLGAIYGVSKPTVSEIINRKTWKHI